MIEQPTVKLQRLSCGAHYGTAPGPCRKCDLPRVTPSGVNHAYGQSGLALIDCNPPTTGVKHG